jgi:hypothetical protein
MLGGLWGYVVSLVVLFGLVIGLSAAGRMVFAVNDAARGAADRLQKKLVARAVAGHASLWREVVIGTTGRQGIVVGPLVVAIISSVLLVVRSAFVSPDDLGGIGLFTWLVLLVSTIGGGGLVIASALRARTELKHACRAVFPNSAPSLSRAADAATRRLLGASGAVSAVGVIAAFVLTFRASDWVPPPSSARDATWVTANLSGGTTGARVCKVDDGAIGVSENRVEINAKLDCDARISGGFRARAKIEADVDYTAANVESSESLVMVNAPPRFFQFGTATVRFRTVSPDAIHGSIEATLDATPALEVRLTF